MATHYFNYSPPLISIYYTWRGSTFCLRLEDRSEKSLNMCTTLTSINYGISQSMFFLKEVRRFGVSYVFSNKLVQVFWLHIPRIRLILPTWWAKLPKKEKLSQFGLGFSRYVSSCIIKNVVWFWGYWGVGFCILLAFWVTFIISGMEVYKRRDFF